MPSEIVWGAAHLAARSYNGDADFVKEREMGLIAAIEMILAMLADILPQDALDALWALLG